MRDRKVLVVEDQPSLAQALRSMLERHGYVVRVAADGEQGVEAATEWAPDAILMDLSMPVMNGFDATAAIRADERTRWIPVMATTALDRPEEVLRALLCGFNKYLRKPYKETELIDQLAELIATAEQQRRLAALAPTPAHGEQLIEIGQILVELMRTLQERMVCDLFAIAWNGSAGAGLLVTVDAAEVAPGLVAEIEGLVWGEEPPEPLPVPTVVCAEGSDLSSAEALGTALTMPLEVGVGLSGAFVVGSLARQEYSEEEVRMVADLAPSVSQVLQASTVVTAPEPAVDEMMQEVQVLLLAEDEAALRWSGPMEAAVPGIKILPLSSPEELDQLPSHTQPHLALVDPRLYDDFETYQLKRSRLGFASVASLELDQDQLADSEERLVAFLMMSVLVGITDSGRTGCLHLQRQGGGPVGMMVFHQGRLAWATSSGSQANLLRILCEVAGVELSAIRSAVQRSVVESRSFHESVVSEGLVAPEQYGEALKVFLTAVVGDLLRLPRPRLFWSQQVRVGSRDLTFDAAEILMSSFGA